MAILAIILVITGSYIRIRTADERDTADWLVMMQLAMCIAGGAVGALLIRRHSLSGTGARRLILYLVAVITSGFFSAYLNLVAGYWVLLAGTGVLLIGLVSSSPAETSLRRIESLILITLSFMVLKDAIVDSFLLEPIETDDVYRLGEGATNANSFGLTAALAFCMSLGVTGDSTARKVKWFALRGVFAAVILLSRSRVALIGLIVGMLIRLWFARRGSREPHDTRSHLLLAALPCCAAALVVLAALGWTMDLPGITTIVSLVNRGADSAELMSVTGRTEIWPYAVQRVFEGATAVVFGHGYGASKEVLNENNWGATFFAFHSHNTFLEAMVATGLLGTLPFLLLIARSLKWITRFAELCRSFSLVFTLRAIAVITAILSSTMTESDMATKIGPVTIVFIFYVLALDRQALFNIEETDGTHA